MFTAIFSHTLLFLSFFTLPNSNYFTACSAQAMDITKIDEQEQELLREQMERFVVVLGPGYGK